MANRLVVPYFVANSKSCRSAAAPTCVPICVSSAEQTLRRCSRAPGSGFRNRDHEVNRAARVDEPVENPAGPVGYLAEERGDASTGERAGIIDERVPVPRPMPPASVRFTAPTPLIVVVPRTVSRSLLMPGMPFGVPSSKSSNEPVSTRESADVERFDAGAGSDVPSALTVTVPAMEPVPPSVRVGVDRDGTRAGAGNRLVLLTSSRPGDRWSCRRRCWRSRARACRCFP